MKRVLIGIALALVACTHEPARPAALPPDATWAGGPDGGSWVSCGQTTKEPYAAYNCRLFFENGVVQAEGHFVHAEQIKGAFEPVGTPFPRISPAWYDGEIIGLEDGRFLVPHGVVEHPFGDGHGKKQEYNLGKAVGDEVSY